MVYVNYVFMLVFFYVILRKRVIVEYNFMIGENGEFFVLRFRSNVDHFVFVINCVFLSVRLFVLGIIRVISFYGLFTTASFSTLSTLIITPSCSLSTQQSSSSSLFPSLSPQSPPSTPPSPTYSTPHLSPSPQN